MNNNRDRDRRNKIELLKAISTGRISANELVQYRSKVLELWDEDPDNQLMAYEKNSGVRVPKRDLRQYLDSHASSGGRIVLFYALEGNNRSEHFSNTNE